MWHIWLQAVYQKNDLEDLKDVNVVWQQKHPLKKHFLFFTFVNSWTVQHDSDVTSPSHQCLQNPDLKKKKIIIMKLMGAM